MTTLRHGKICYIEIPANDPERSAEFYRTAFGWNVRRRGDGALAFDDTTTEVSGAWISGRPPSATPGLMTYIMVADVDAASKAIVDAGGEIVVPPDPDAPELIAQFRDPAGNILGIYQEPDL